MQDTGAGFVDTNNYKAVKALADAGLTYKEIIPAVIKKSKDPNYYIPVKIPNS